MQRADSGGILLAIALAALGAFILVSGHAPYATLAWNFGPFSSDSAMRVAGFVLVAVGVSLAWTSRRR